MAVMEPTGSSLTPASKASPALPTNHFPSSLNVTALHPALSESHHEPSQSRRHLNCKWRPVRSPVAGQDPSTSPPPWWSNRWPCLFLQNPQAPGSKRQCPWAPIQVAVEQESMRADAIDEEKLWLVKIAEVQDAHLSEFRVRHKGPLSLQAIGQTRSTLAAAIVTLLGTEAQGAGVFAVWARLALPLPRNTMTRSIQSARVVAVEGQGFRTVVGAFIRTPRHVRHFEFVANAVAVQVVDTIPSRTIARHFP